MAEQHKKIKITWVRSIIGGKEQHRRTIRALGLRRLHHSVVKEASPQIRGMVHHVTHLINVEELSS